MPKFLITQLEVSYITKMNPAYLFNTDGNFVTLVLIENKKFHKNSGNIYFTY